MNLLTKVLVGSQAHGLADENSDMDYRGVFVQPTSEIVGLGGKLEHTSWIEGKEDDTSWEIGKFLLMATKSNPTVLETFLAPEVEGSDYSEEFRSLFEYVWSSEYVKDAFVGYGINQRKKFLERKDNRAPKYACAYLRVLYNAWQLLSTGTFSVSLVGSPVFDDCKRFKYGNYQVGEVIQACYEWEEKVKAAYDDNPDKKVNLEPVNEFLLKIRKNNW